MNKLLISATLLALLTFGALVLKKDSEPQNDPVEQTMFKWEQFKKTHNQMYSSMEEEIHRYNIFCENLKFIDSYKDNKNFKLGITKFADLSQEEFAATYLTLKPVPQSKKTFVDAPASSEVPLSFNWSEQNIVPPVLNQGACGSCWAFSATAAISSAYNIRSNSDEYQLSPQQLVDCSASFGNNGCNGGWMDYAFDYAIKTGLASNDQYKYTGTDDVCNTQLVQKFGVNQIAGYTDVPTSTLALQQALVKTPVSVAVDATYWFLYESGVFEICGNTLNHGVLLTGYTAGDNGTWTIKNSWGQLWGEKGYIRLNTGNSCGILEAASYPRLLAQN